MKLILARTVAAFSLALLAAPAMAQNYYYVTPPFTFSQPQTSSFLNPNQLMDLENLRNAPLAAADAHRNALLQQQLLRQQIELNRLRLQQQQR